MTRVSLGAQSFRPHLLATLERLATPETVRGAVGTLRAAGVDEPQPRPDVWGSGSVAPQTSRPTSTTCSSLGPTTSAAYELEAKPGTRFTAPPRRRAGAAGRPDRALTTSAWSTRAARPPATAGTRPPTSAARPRGAAQPGLLAGARLPRHRRRRRLARIGLERRRNRPSPARATWTAVEAGGAPPAEIELLTPAERGMRAADARPAARPAAAAGRPRGRWSTRRRLRAAGRRPGCVERERRTFGSPTAAGSWPTTCVASCCDERAATPAHAPPGA